MRSIPYAVVGLRGIGHLHCRFAEKIPDMHLVAVVDTDSELVKKFEANYHVKGFTHIDALIDSGLTQAVSIATPHYCHFELGMKCLQAGLHIFVEKPLAIKISEADQLIAEAKRQGLKICVGHQYRTFDSIKIIKQAIASNQLGRILRILWSWIEFRPECYYSRDPWRCSWQGAGGGILPNQVSHDLDLICWLFGKAKKVNASIHNQMHCANIEDFVSASITFCSGAHGTFQFSMNHPKGYSVRQIAGDRGVLHIADVQSLTSNKSEEILFGRYRRSLFDEKESLKKISEQPQCIWKKIMKRPSRLKSFVHRVLRRLGIISKKEHGIETLLRSFVKSILYGGNPLVDGESARDGVELINAIVLSGITQKTVTLPLNPKDVDNVYEKLVNEEIKI